MLNDISREAIEILIPRRAVLPCGDLGKGTKCLVISKNKVFLYPYLHSEATCQMEPINELLYCAWSRSDGKAKWPVVPNSCLPCHYRILTGIGQINSDHHFYSAYSFDDLRGQAIGLLITKIELLASSYFTRAGH